MQLPNVLREKQKCCADMRQVMNKSTLEIDLINFFIPRENNIFSF